MARESSKEKVVSEGADGKDAEKTPRNAVFAVVATNYSYDDQNYQQDGVSVPEICFRSRDNAEAEAIRRSVHDARRYDLAEFASSYFDRSKQKPASWFRELNCDVESDESSSNGGIYRLNVEACTDEEVIQVLDELGVEFYQVVEVDLED